MSWDISVQDLPPVATIEDIPDDFEPAPLGLRATLIDRILAALPGADFSDPSWGIIEGEGWSIEVSTGAEDVCQSIALHVRGGGAVIATVDAIIAQVGGRALDCQTGAFYDPGAAKQSFADWSAYRDQVLGRAED
ncbi:hypothetical protein [Sphingomonas sanxanigenens]|uniref:Uncharacterized protein n=1 Tax=Sphingomonas sanxanigenens DSM 19645 = NX02 TaxID=1123269 RepID=W0AM60_9SPHN|nr:hypothetical protein [Sphingomonas sanxanigenens]AHE56790.1 hypothetical protein NX02_25940 [Sphingomonas sanxanigenens DSM 19645 = NX02]